MLDLTMSFPLGMAGKGFRFHDQSLLQPVSVFLSVTEGMTFPAQIYVFVKSPSCSRLFCPHTCPELSHTPRVSGHMAATQRARLVLQTALLFPLCYGLFSSFSVVSSISIRFLMILRISNLFFISPSCFPCILTPGLSLYSATGLYTTTFYRPLPVPLEGTLSHFE